MEQSADAFLNCLICHKLISTYHASAEYRNIRVHLTAHLFCQGRQCFICCKRKHIHLRNLSRFITKIHRIHIMLYQIRGNHDIPDINARIQRSCNPCVDHRLHLKFINQNLCTDRRIHFANAASHHYHRTTMQKALAELHACFLNLTLNLHTLFQSLYLNLHCADNSCFSHMHHLYLPYIIYYIGL